jgi:hypothetical protein
LEETFETSDSSDGDCRIECDQRAGNGRRHRLARLYDTHSGVSPTDSIPVNLTLTLDPSSEALTTDAGGQVTSGLDTSDITANLFSGLDPNVNPSTDSLQTDINVAFGCSGNFTAFCTGGPPYDFFFNSKSSTTMSPFDPNSTLGGSQNTLVNPGDSVTYLFGAFHPTGGIAPAGTYQFFNASLLIQVFDLNFNQVSGDPTSGPLHIADVPIADTQSSNSTFSRIVIPEPATWGLAAGVLLACAALARRQRA